MMVTPGQLCFDWPGDSDSGSGEGAESFAELCASAQVPVVAPESMNLREEDELGHSKGRHSQVWRGQYIVGNKIPILFKQVTPTEDHSMSISQFGSHNLNHNVRQAVREARILRKFEGDVNVVACYGVCEHPACGTGLVLELGACDLEDLLVSRGDQVSRGNMVHMARGIVQGLAAVARQDIAHGDLKPANIIAFHTDGVWWCKVGDFGSAVEKEPVGDDRLSAGTNKWAAPELLMTTQDPGTASDIYSFALILWFMLTRERDPLPNASRDAGNFGLELDVSMRGLRPPLPLNLSLRLKLLLEQLWHPEPTLRFPKPWRLAGQGDPPTMQAMTEPFCPRLFELLDAELAELARSDLAFNPPDKPSVPFQLPDWQPMAT